MLTNNDRNRQYFIGIIKNIIFSNIWNTILKSILLKIISIIDAFTECTGKFISIFVIILVLLVGYDVSMRYLFQSGSIGIQELEWHLFSVVLLIGTAYTLKHDEHVRLDILYRSRLLTDKHRAWIDVFGILFYIWERLSS